MAMSNGFLYVYQRLLPTCEGANGASNVTKPQLGLGRAQPLEQIASEIRDSTRALFTLFMLYDVGTPNVVYDIDIGTMGSIDI